MSDVRRIQWLIAAAVVLTLGVCWADNRFAARHGEGTADVRRANADRDVAIAHEKMADQRIAVLRDSVEAAHAESARAHAAAASADSAFRQQRKAYKALRDTLNLADTAAVKAALAQADSTIAAGDSTIRAKDAEIAKKDLEIARKDSVDQERDVKDAALLDRIHALERLNRSMEKLIPGKTEKFITAVKWLAAGTVVGLAASHR